MIKRSKKFIKTTATALTLGAALSCPQCVQAAFTFTAAIEFGDINADGAIDAADEELITQHIQAATNAEIAQEHPGWTLRSYAAVAADANQDGLINSEDLEIIRDTIALKEKRVQVIDVDTNITKQYKRGTNFSLNAKAQGALTYKSSNANVVTVSAKGTVNIQGYGTAVITVTAKETALYKSAVKKVTVTVVPAKLTVKVAAKGSGTLKIDWKRDTTVDGYQIQCSTKKTFPGSNTMVGTVSKNATITSTLRNLSKGKTYYVRIRGFKRIDGIPVYGVWSAVKSAAVK